MRDLKFTVTMFGVVHEKTWGYDTPLGLIHEHLHGICPTYHISNIKFVDEKLNKKQLKPHNMYSQNNEEQIIADFFGDFKGAVLDIGANDGKTYSNSLKLIENGWRAFLVEPSPTCGEKINTLHAGNELVKLLQVAIGAETGEAVFHESGRLNVPELPEENISLVSTLIPKEKDRWTPLKMDWKEYPVKVFNWADFKKQFNIPDHLDFISIDAEGVDMAILKQIDLSLVKLLCVEYNLDQAVKREILEYTGKFGMDKIIYETGENIIVCRS